MTEPLDLDALEHDTHLDVLGREAHTIRALIAELRACRAELEEWQAGRIPIEPLRWYTEWKRAEAERDYLLTAEAADAMLRDALARAERAEAAMARVRAMIDQCACPHCWATVDALDGE